jgi:hypothetical protein
MGSYSVAEKARIVAATQQGAGKCDMSRKDTAEMVRHVRMFRLGIPRLPSGGLCRR